jgi:hypothetical protein
MQDAMAQHPSNALINVKLFNGVDNKILEDVTVFVVDGKIERAVRRQSISDRKGVFVERVPAPLCG